MDNPHQPLLFAQRDQRLIVAWAEGAKSIAGDDDDHELPRSPGFVEVDLPDTTVGKLEWVGAINRNFLLWMLMLHQEIDTTLDIRAFNERHPYALMFLIGDADALRTTAVMGVSLQVGRTAWAADLVEILGLPVVVRSNT